MIKNNHERYFVDGPVLPSRIAEMIEAHSKKVDVGAHGLFLGQVRADTNDSGTTTAIEYSGYFDMAIMAIDEAREAVISEYHLRCLHVLHSVGVVPVGGICLAVMSSSAHRMAAQEAVMDLVGRIKHNVPIWGKELKNSGKQAWKVNLEREEPNRG